MGRTRPGREFENVMAGPGRAGPKVLKMLWSGPGWAGQLPMIESLMGRARSRPIDSKFDGPGRAAAHEMLALFGPLCPAH